MRATTLTPQRLHWYVCVFVYSIVLPPHFPCRASSTSRELRRPHTHPGATLTVVPRRDECGGWCLLFLLRQFAWRCRSVPMPFYFLISMSSSLELIRTPVIKTWLTSWPCVASHLISQIVFACELMIPSTQRMTG